jgi:hypothetical protein
MNGSLLAIAVLVYGLAWCSFYYGDHRAKPEKKHAWERQAAGISALATFMLLLSVSGWFGAAWNDVGAGIGLFILIIVTAASLAFGGFAIIRGFRHHRHSTLAVGIIAGGAVALFYGDFKAIKVNSGHALTSAWHGVTGAPAKVNAVTAHAVHPGAHASAGGSSAAVLILILLLAAAVILGGIVIRKHHSGAVKDVGAAKAISGSSGTVATLGGIRP